MLKKTLSSPITDKYFENVVQAIDLIENQIQAPLALEEVTRVISDSHWQAQRIFRSVVGISIGQYIRERRLSEASQQLKNSNARIIDIALDFQYQSHEAFSRAFKSFYGFSPQEWREQTPSVSLQMRNRITNEKLAYFWGKIQREPTIVFFPERKMAGSKIDFQSHFIPGFDCKSTLVPHWAKFIEQIPRLPHRVNKNGYGVIIGDNLEITTENLSYVSAIEVSQFSSEHDALTQYSVPEGTFASFENYSTRDYSGSLLDFIYGIWLPTSGYKRAKNVDIEVFGPEFRMDSENSRSQYLIPITNIP